MQRITALNMSQCHRGTVGTAPAPTSRMLSFSGLLRPIQRGLVLGWCVSHCRAVNGRGLKVVEIIGILTLTDKLNIVDFEQHLGPYWVHGVREDCRLAMGLRNVW